MKFPPGQQNTKSPFTLSKQNGTIVMGVAQNQFCAFHVLRTIEDEQYASLSDT